MNGNEVAELLGSYAGISVLVVLLVSFAKAVMAKAVEGREPLVALASTYVLGVTAKLVLPVDAYGDASAKAWGLHLIILLFVAIGAKAVHDGPWNAVLGKLKEGGAAKLMLVMLIPAVLLAGCTCAIEKRAVENVSTTQEIVLVEYEKYVAADAALSSERREDRKELVASLRRMVQALLRSLED